MAQYEHRDANNEWHPFSHMENEKIERAYRANGCRVHLTMPLNPVGFREFEIRFGDSARSKKMPRPPSTKIIQVNVASGATRVVRRLGPIDQPTMAPTLQYHGPATKKGASCQLTSRRWGQQMQLPIGLLQKVQHLEGVLRQKITVANLLGVTRSSSAARLPPV